MIIVGAKGFAKEVLEILHQLKETEDIFFYDDISDDAPNTIHNHYKVLHDMKEVSEIYRSISKKFTIGIGNPSLRNSLFQKFTRLGGEFTSTISPFAHIGHFGNAIGEGANIMTGTVITNNVSIGTGALINLNCTIGHDTVIGKFSELSPGVHVSGRCIVGDFCFIGTGAVLLPDVSLGNNVIVGAGAVINRNIESNSVVAGVPGKVLKKI